MEIIGTVNKRMKRERDIGLLVEQEDESASSDKIESEIGYETLVENGMLNNGKYRIEYDDIQVNNEPNTTSNTFYTTAEPLSGRIFVIGTSQDVFPIANKTIKQDETRIVTRDDKRRATHNEVERRRRDKINHWIMKLGKIIPECKQDSTKGSFEAQSKGGILAKACDYITEMRESNERLLVYAKENEQLLADIENLSQQHEQLREENARLKSLLRQAGIQHTEGIQ